MIKSLPTEVREKLRSGVAIPSLQQCVEELILNSIDAGATCVGVRMDMEAFKVQVIDNGSGMTAEDMECVGTRYCTSKCSSVEDLDNLRWFGFRGEALASLVSLATLVEISSRTRLSVKTHVKLFKDGKGLDVFEAETVRPSAGTTVIICNFLYNMPVRRKRVDGVLEGERIRHRVEAISLMHPSVSFTLKNDCTGTMMVQLPKARTTYHRFVQIHSLARAEKLGEVSYTHKQFQVTGFIGKEGHYNTSLQYLYVNDRLLLKTQIHKLLNFLLRRLSSSNQKNEAPDGTSVLRSPKQKRHHEQNGVYIINIKCSYSEYDVCLEPGKTLIEFKDWDGVLVCVEEAVKAFLQRENLVCLFSQDDLDCASSEVFVSDKTEKQSTKAGQAATGTSSIECGVEMKLASKSVHRKSADDRVCCESGVMESRADETEQLEQEGTSVHESQRTPQCDLKSASPNTRDDEELTFSQSGEGSGIAQMPKRQASALLKEKESQLIDKTATCEANSPHCFSQAVQPDFNSNKEEIQSPDGHEQSFVNDRKISLSDPYVHKSLQKRDHFQNRQSTKYEERSSKRKNSLGADEDRASQKLYVPFKIPRILSCQKASTSRELGSLDKFRRMFAKYSEVKLHHPRIQNDAERPHTNSSANNPETVSVCEDNGATGTREEERTTDSSQRPLMISDVKDQRKGQMSAAKLCNLTQDETENVSLHVYNEDLQQRPHNQILQEPEEHVDPGLDQKEEDPAAGDWLHHYDASIGKIVYVNRITGLSRYEDPTMEETQVRCTSDVTNMAVSVVSETGVEYRCYPFHVDVVLPFLPKSRPERVISSGTDRRADADRSNSLSSLYSKWKNPVFVLPPAVGVDISSRQADGLAVKIHNILFPYRFSKAMIHSMKVIHQVDKKFLACLINTRDGDAAADCEAGVTGNLLVLVDQHAAHERVRLENLVADSYEDDPDVHGERRLCSSTILPPLEISVTEEELRLLRSCQQQHLRSLGLDVSFSETAAPHVFVGMVPLCFMEKERNELRRGRSSVIKPVVEEYLREQIELLRSAGRVKGTLPLTVLKVLASLACHGAIKFNDTLSRDECCSLVASLSSCQLPFQCAHGRPSIVPLVDILHLDKDLKDVQKPNLQKLRRMYKAWKLYGNN